MLGPNGMSQLNLAIRGKVERDLISLPKTTKRVSNDLSLIRAAFFFVFASGKWWRQDLIPRLCYSYQLSWLTPSKKII